MDVKTRNVMGEVRKNPFDKQKLIKDADYKLAYVTLPPGQVNSRLQACLRHLASGPGKYIERDKQKLIKDADYKLAYVTLPPGQVDTERDMDRQGRRRQIQRETS